MTQITYTFCKLLKGKIYFRGRDENMQEINSIIKDYKPTLYVETTDETDKVSYMDKPVKAKEFENIWTAREWYKGIKDTPIKAHGNSDFAQQFLIGIYEGNDVLGTIVNIRVCYVDIETDWNGGKTTPEEAKDRITAITIHDSLTDTFYVAGLCNYDRKKDMTNVGCNIEYSQFDEEIDLIRWYINHYNTFAYDIIVGFNSRFFDIPYMINRAWKLVGEAETSLMSPFNTILTRQVTERKYNEDVTYNDYEIFGSTHLDYLEVYKKHAVTTLDSYKLDNIAEYELGQNKLSYEEEGSLFNLFRENPQKFIEYNIKDVKLLIDIEKKRKLISVIVFMSYLAKTNFENAMGTTKLWEDLIANFLFKSNTVPLYTQEFKSQGKHLVGGYVREPVLGLHKWGITIDGNSLYPHLMMEFMIDLPSHIPYAQLPSEVQKVVDKLTMQDLLHKRADLSVLKKYNIGMAANMECYDNTKQRLLPNLMKEFYAKRKVFKKEMYKYEKMALEIENDLERVEEYLEYKLLAEQNDTFQHAIKILINSVYGAICNKYFKYFKFELGESITTSGQLVNMWVGKAVEDFMIKEIFDGEKPKNQIITYGDTDSIFFSMEDVLIKFDMLDKSDAEITSFIDDFAKNVINPIVEECTKDLQEYLNAYENKMVWERENIYKSLIMISKKRYAMQTLDKEGVSYVHNPKYKIMGLESQRSSTPKWSQAWLLDSYKICLNKSESDIQEFILQKENEFYTFDLNKIAIPTGVNGLDKYKDSLTIYGKGTPKHVKAALIHNHLIDINNLPIERIATGTKIKYLELKKVNPINQEVIGFNTFLPKEFGLDNSVDRTKMFEKGFVDPLKNFLDVIGWETKATNKIADYFSFE